MAQCPDHVRHIAATARSLGRKRFAGGHRFRRPGSVFPGLALARQIPSLIHPLSGGTSNRLSSGVTRTEESAFDGQSFIGQSVIEQNKEQKAGSCSRASQTGGGYFASFSSAGISASRRNFALSSGGVGLM